MPVVTATFATFLILISLLGYQLRAGHDPALGAKTANAQVQPRRVLLRKVVRRKVIVTIKPADQAYASAGGSSGSSGSSVSASTSAPSAAPPPPAPAPVATSSS